MRRLISLALLLVAIPASAATFRNGYVSGEGYTYNDGYWYRSDVPHVRSQFLTPGYWSYGAYYPGGYSWRYSRVVFRDRVSLPVPKPSVTYQTPGWRGKLLEIASARDKSEAAIRAAAFEQQYYLDTVKALGLEGNFRWNGYGTVPPYAVPGLTPRAMPYAAGGYSTVTNFGAQGNTTYGYSYNTLAQLYGDTNLNQLYLAASQLTAGAQKNAADGSRDFHSLVGAEGANRARVAEILARGQMAFQIITALNGPGSIETKGFSFRFTTDGGVERTDADVKPDVKAELLKQWTALAGSRCASCHSGAKKAGGFDVATYPSLPMVEKQKVWKLLTTLDDAKVMPRPAPGAKVQRLTLDEQRLFFLN